MNKLLLSIAFLFVACPSKPYVPTDPVVKDPSTRPTSQATTQEVSPLPAGILAQGQGAHGLVQVSERDGLRLLTIDGVVQGAAPLQKEKIQADAMVELLVALRPTAKTALVIGLGTGQTATQLAAKGITVEAVEIEPLVAEYAKKFFDFKGSVIVADGRKILETSSKTYDIVLMDATTGKEPPKELMTKSVVSYMKQRSSEKDGVIAARLLARPSDPEVRAYIKLLGERFAVSFGSGLADEEQNIYALSSTSPFELYSLSGLMLRPLSLMRYELSSLGLQNGEVSVLGYLIRLREDNTLALDLPHSEMGAIRFTLSGPEVAALEKLLPAKTEFPTSGDIMSDGDTTKTLEPLLGGGGVKRSDVRFSPVIVLVEGTAQFRAAVDADRVFSGKVLDPSEGPSTKKAKEPLLPYGGVLYALSVEKVVASYTQSSWKTLEPKLKPHINKALAALKKGDTALAEKSLQDHQDKLKTELNLIAEKLTYYQDIGLLYSLLQKNTATLTPTSTPLEKAIACDRVTANDEGELYRSDIQYEALFNAFPMCAIFWYEKAASKGPGDKDAELAAGRLLYLYNPEDDAKKRDALLKKFSDIEELEAPPTK